MNHRIAPLLMALVAGGSMVFSQAQTVRKPRNGKKYQIVMVAKLEGMAWFDNMRPGHHSFRRRPSRSPPPRSGGSNR